MRIFVTGGSGKVGRAAIVALKHAGHKVVNLDIRPSPDSVRTVIADCADFGAVMGAFSGVDTLGGMPDAIVHLAGIPMPGLTTDHRAFENNTVSTYNVFSACSRLGIRRIVWASSETIMGLPYRVPPDFVPVDETHPDRPGWSYALSKVLGETMADNFARWNAAASITSLRFSNVYDAADYANLPDLHRSTASRKANLWAYVDARDCGQACCLAVEKALPGHQRLVIAAADSIMDVPSADLMAEHYPSVALRSDLGRYESLLSSAKARDLIGYVPQFSWRQAG
jgi:nucleoside-diphosphate-sugar epimerase